MKMLPTIQTRGADELAALLVLNALSLDEAAAEAGMPPEALLEYMERRALEIDQEAARLRSTGRLAEVKASGLLLKLLARFDEQIPDMPATTGSRVAEILLRISGLAEKRAVELRQPTPQTEKFSINITIRGENILKTKTVEAAPNLIDVTPTTEVLDE